MSPTGPPNSAVPVGIIEAQAAGALQTRRPVVIPDYTTVWLFTERLIMDGGCDRVLMGSVQRIVRK
ncbi:MAG: hypothetical protein ACO0C9_00015 [Candidatus Methanosuratincola verstraetei]|jgi:hypothetical protein